ncbi:MAG: polymerase III, delta prime subunit protein [Candidatus Azambacteria bacterium GW2011_GWA2_45_90]|uniref:Polymerase III, delta prime subunit protein n=2 Tax=Candidatus Azamiibacteriota TaxID=1752741 RepID=A0A0G1QPB8_9BACT|nr:MAG: polymerase III, delta prime subunit protein [Candidatus Azambacteria bacterium GW2011_GWA2_45_90]
MASLLSNQNAFRRLTERAADIGGGSYLFWGPEGLGKMEAAIEFAKFLECLKKTPCLNCRSCVDIDKRIHPDVLIVEPKIGESGEEKEIGIGEVRRIKHFLSFFPQSGSYKIVVVDKADRLTEEAQNSFLKILEEPKGRAILILVAANPGRLLETILSRLFPVKFKTWPREEIYRLLKGKGADEKTARVAARKAMGRPALAEEMLSDPHDDEQEAIFELIDKSAAGRFVFVEEILKNEKGNEDLLDAGLFLFRDMLLLKLGLNDLVVNVNFREKAEKAAAKYEAGKIPDIIRSILKTSIILKDTNANSRLALENLMLTL